MLFPVPPDIDPDDDADDRQRDEGDLSEVLVDQGLVGSEEMWGLKLITPPTNQESV